MKRKIILMAILPLLLWAFQEPVRLRKVKISEHISAEIPERFILVSEQELAEKYVSARKPLALFTSPDGKVDFSINISSNQWQHFDLPLAKDFYKASLSTLYSELNMLNEEVVEVNGQPIAVFEYIGTVEEEGSPIRQSGSISKYTYLGYAMVNGKVVVASFTAPAHEKARWAPVAKEVLGSLKIKKTL